MRYRRYLAVLSILLVLGAAALFFAPSKPGLIVRGKPVSDWALALGGPAPTEPAQAVIKSLGPEAVPYLVRMLRTKDSFLARSINALAPKLPSRLDDRLHRIFKINETVQRRHTAAMALGLMGTNAAPAIPALLDALRDQSIGVSVTAALVLARIGSGSLPGLIAALDDRSASTRRAAMTGLAHVGTEAGGAVPKLMVLLQHPPDRLPARTALQGIGKPAVSALIELLNHPSNEMRVEAIGILGNIGGPARGAIPALTNLTQDPSPTIRSGTMNSLALICRSCDPVVSVLQSALDDESAEVRRVATTHLRAEPRAAQRTVDRLLHKLEKGTPSEKQRVIGNLGLMGAPAEPAVPVLRAIAQGDNRKERELAREALLQIEGATQKNEVLP